MATVGTVLPKRNPSILPADIAEAIAGALTTVQRGARSTSASTPAEASVEPRRDFGSAGAPDVALLREEPDNAEYGGAIYTVDGVPVRFRRAKVTPKKVGAFVTAWRRAEAGEVGSSSTTEPMRAEDGVAALAVHIESGYGVGLEPRRGVFIFPTEVLGKRGLVSVAGKGGKRGFRIYPSWSVVTSAQALRTQKWQSEHFTLLG